MFAYNDITNAARNGARVAIVDQTANKAARYGDLQAPAWA